MEYNKDDIIAGLTYNASKSSYHLDQLKVMKAHQSRTGVPLIIAKVKWDKIKGQDLSLYLSS